MKELLLGFAKRDFSPDGPVSMNSTITGTTLTDRLYANCLAWKQGDKTILQFSIDLRNIYESFYNLLRDGIAETVGLPKEQILISVTHNHSSPDIALMNRPDIQDWWERIGKDAMFGVGLDAIADLAPVTGAVAGRGTTYKCAFSRRYFREDGLLAGVAAPKSESPLVRHESEADPELRVVRITREGKPAIVLVNFQTHAATALATYRDRICSDFVGPMREVIEAEGDIAFYLQGACGNLNTLTRLEWEKEGWNRDYWLVGESIGKTALEALKTAKPLPLGELKLNWTPLTCRVNHNKSYLAPVAREIAREEDPDKKAARMEEAGITSRYELSVIISRSTMPDEREMPLATLSCGEFAMGFAPVELFDVCGKSFRECSPYDMTFFVGYANGSHNYMPCANFFPNGGYEPLQCLYVPGTGERIALELARQLHQMKKED